MARTHRRIWTLTCGMAMAAWSAPALAQSFPAPLPEETIPSTTTLPERYPPSWVVVSDFNFNAIPDGRGVIVDTASDNQPFKGMFQAAQFGNILVSAAKPDIYTAETYYSRLSRGERTDVITIWDKVSLKPKGEIVLPGGKRQQTVTYKNSFQFTNGEKWALVANFTPAQSITVVDLEGRKVLAELDLPGCSMIYPTGERGFATFCADGTMSSIALGPDGRIASTVTSKQVQDIENQAMFMMPAMIGRTAWFVTFRGQLKAFDLSGAVAKEAKGGFSVGTAEGGQPEWRPGGWQVISSDAAGRLYVLMNASGREGSHKDGGTEVWVMDTVKKKRILRIPLQGLGVSIEVTREAEPSLVVARADSGIDVYDAATGKLKRNLGNTVAFNPLTITAIQ